MVVFPPKYKPPKRRTSANLPPPTFSSQKRGSEEAFSHEYLMETASYFCSDPKLKSILKPHFFFFVAHQNQQAQSEAVLCVNRSFAYRQALMHRSEVGSLKMKVAILNKH